MASLAVRESAEWTVFLVSMVLLGSRAGQLVGFLVSLDVLEGKD